MGRNPTIAYFDRVPCLLRTATNMKSMRFCQTYRSRWCFIVDCVVEQREGRQGGEWLSMNICTLHSLRQVFHIRIMDLTSTSYSYVQVIMYISLCCWPQSAAGQSAVLHCATVCKGSGRGTASLSERPQTRVVGVPLLCHHEKQLCQGTNTGQYTLFTFSSSHFLPFGLRREREGLHSSEQCGYFSYSSLSLPPSFSPSLPPSLSPSLPPTPSLCVSS